MPLPKEDRKAAIRTELLKRAKAGETITYGALGLLLDGPARGPWKKVLDAIGDEERSEGRPDLACLVVRAATGFPSQITETSGGRNEALAERQRVFDCHRS